LPFLPIDCRSLAILARNLVLLHVGLQNSAPQPETKSIPAVIAGFSLARAARSLVGRKVHASRRVQSVQVYLSRWFVEQGDHCGRLVSSWSAGSRWFTLPIDLGNCRLKLPRTHKESQIDR
jgi:hypothetical protein